MENLPTFNTLVFPDKPNEKIITFQFIEITSNIRIYYKPNEHNNTGFIFYITDFHSSLAESEKYASCYDDPSFKALCMFWGYVHWDGLRHLHMGDKVTDTENYLYYVDTEIISQVFRKLRELELKHCDKLNVNNYT